LSKPLPSLKSLPPRPSPALPSGSHLGARLLLGAHVGLRVLAAADQHDGEAGRAAGRGLDRRHLGGDLLADVLGNLLAVDDLGGAGDGGWGGEGEGSGVRWTEGG
jgi:hypothetical protein